MLSCLELIAILVHGILENDIVGGNDRSVGLSVAGSFDSLLQQRYLNILIKHLQLRSLLIDYVVREIIELSIDDACSISVNRFRHLLSNLELALQVHDLLSDGYFIFSINGRCSLID